jgi:signal transduction histidine kinase
METERPLVLPHPRSREFAELNQSLQAMTDRLLREEVALRHKITEVETRTQQLRAAQAQLVRSERLASVGQLAAGVAHEIGNPIAALMGLQDLILQGGLNADEQEEFVRRMRKETQRIHRIVRDLLHFARPKPATSSEQLPSASVRSALEETLGLLEPQPSWRNITVQTKLADGLPSVLASHEALVQIFLNLLLNAAAACAPTGVVRITAASWSSPTENARGDSDNTSPGFVEVSVEDDGPGVPEALRETLFEPFVSGKDVGEGTGLGLSVCRNLVDQIATLTALPAVTIELDQAFTAGARFVLRLPTSSQTT